MAKGRDLLDGLREQLKAVAAEHAFYGWQRQCATLMGGLGGPVRGACACACACERARE